MALSQSDDPEVLGGELEDESCGRALLYPFRRLFGVLQAWPNASLTVAIAVLLCARLDVSALLPAGSGLHLLLERAMDPQTWLDGTGVANDGSERLAVIGIFLVLALLLTSLMLSCLCCSDKFYGSREDEQSLMAARMLALDQQRGFGGGGHRRRRESFPQAETLMDVPGRPLERGAMGLQNLGLTCYVAGPLQALNGIAELDHYFLSDRYKENMGEAGAEAPSPSLAQAYASQLRQMWRGDLKACAPRDFIKSLARCLPALYGPPPGPAEGSHGGKAASSSSAAMLLPMPQQHDNQELLMMMLDRLHNELRFNYSNSGSDTSNGSGDGNDSKTKGGKKKGSTRVKAQEVSTPTASSSASSSPSSALSSVAAADRAWQEHLLSQHRSLVTDLFQSQQVTTTSCLAITESGEGCGYSAQSFEPSLFTCLAIPPSPHVLRIKLVASAALQALAKGETELRLPFSSASASKRAGVGGSGDGSSFRAVDYRRMPVVSEHTVVMPQRVPAIAVPAVQTSLPGQEPADEEEEGEPELVAPTVRHLKEALRASYSSLFAARGAFHPDLSSPSSSSTSLLPFDVHIVELSGGLMRYPLKDSAHLSGLYRRSSSLSTAKGGVELVAYLLPNLRHASIGWRMLPVIHREWLWTKREEGSSATSNGNGKHGGHLFEPTQLSVPAGSIPLVLRVQEGDSVAELMFACQEYAAHTWDAHYRPAGAKASSASSSSSSASSTTSGASSSNGQDDPCPRIAWADDATGGLSCGLRAGAESIDGAGIGCCRKMECRGCLIPGILPARALRAAHGRYLEARSSASSSASASTRGRASSYVPPFTLENALLEAFICPSRYGLDNVLLTPDAEDFPRCIAIDWSDIDIGAEDAEQLGDEALLEPVDRNEDEDSSSKGNGKAGSKPALYRPSYLRDFPFCPTVVKAPLPTRPAFYRPRSASDESDDASDGEAEASFSSAASSKGSDGELNPAVLTSVPNDTDIPVPLTRCLALQYGRVTYLRGDNAYACPRCSRKVEKASQVTHLVRAPRVLTILLKRFVAVDNYGTVEKVDIPVTFPINDLALDQYLLTPPTQQKQGKGSQKAAASSSRSNTRAIDGVPSAGCSYDLFAVVNHYGGINGGHYTASVKHPVSGRWHGYDDAHVRPLLPAQAQQPQQPLQGASNGAGSGAAETAAADEAAGFQAAVEGLEARLMTKKGGEAAGEEEIEQLGDEQRLRLERSLVTGAAYLLFYRRK